jgi:hypothetical protein
MDPTYRAYSRSFQSIDIVLAVPASLNFGYRLRCVFLVRWKCAALQATDLVVHV